MNGEIRECKCYTTCVACGAKYKPKYFWPTDMTIKPIACSDHVCNPRRLAKRERQLRHEFDDESPYCECNDLDCKLEYAQEMMNEM